jgi:hypothetical protein
MKRALPFLGFLGDHRAGAAQHGKVGRVPVAVRDGESLHGSDLGVIAEDRSPSVEEHALAVTAGAIEEEQRMIADRAGERIAEHAPRECDERPVACKHTIEKGEPGRAFAAGRDRGDLGDPVRPGVGAHLAGRKIDGAAWRVEEPGIGVPFVGDGSVPAIGAREPFDGGNGLGARDRGGELRRSFGVDDLCRGFTADMARKIERALRFVDLPALPVPDQPPAPEIDEA